MLIETVLVLTLCLLLYVFFQYSKIKYYLKLFTYYAASTIICGMTIPLYVWNLWKPQDVLIQVSMAGMMQNINKLIGVEWRLRNGEILTEDQGAVIVANHQSSLDILSLLKIWELVRKMSPICKKELLYAGTYGIVGYLAGCIFIDRKNPTAAYNQLQSTKAKIQNKYKIYMYPEGTRNKERKKPLLPFKRGAFTMAVAAQAPIIPVVHSPYYFIDEKECIFNNGYVILQCLEPIPTVGLTNEDIPALMVRVYDLMSRTYVQLAQEVDADIQLKKGK